MHPGVIGCITFVLAAVLTGLVRRYAVVQGIIDRPNARSSHSVPTPRGGGAAIVVTGTIGCATFMALGILGWELGNALIWGGLAVAVVGFLDDRGSVPAGIRLAIHIGAALWALWCLGGLPSLQIGAKVVTLGPVGYVLGTLAIVWVLNLFNFMDGIDGIAASEAVFVTCAAALLICLEGGSTGVAAAGLTFGTACAGFLIWNWPPAKIFMGDVGSGYIGYVIGVLALAATGQHPADVWVWLILGGVFFADATITLIRRIARAEKVYQAHRSHAYQCLAARWRSHLRVTVSVIGVNLLWLLPCALVAAAHPKQATWVALLALTPITILAIVSGAGRPLPKS